MASESADGALSDAATSSLICEKAWKLGDPIHSTGFGAIENKEMRCICHCKGRRSLYGTRVRSEMSCEIDQSPRITYLRVWSKSPALSGSVQRTTVNGREKRQKSMVPKDHSKRLRSHLSRP
jgi:hypothetical protein